ncbi:MAG: hypothetical protein RLZZ226_323 [Pseudomonadota bacterium]
MIAAILTDIEGTTTALSFVKEVLFPYSRSHIASFLDANRYSPEVGQLLAEARRLADLPDNGDDALLVGRLIEWIDQDRKLTPLKALQGMIWEQGYLRGELQGHLYPEVAEWLTTWQQQGYRLGIYSSGSVHAQKLLFAHTHRGDLTPLFSHYFDTRVGAKQAVDSYREISRLMACTPDALLFLSDMPGELNAAREAGLITCQLIRDAVGQPAAQEEPIHPVAHDFSDVNRLLQASTQSMTFPSP